MVPLRTKAAGTPLVPGVDEALNPKLTEPAAGIVFVQDSLVTWTALPLWVALAFQTELIRWAAGKEKSRAQPSTACAEVLRTVTSALKLLPQSLSR